MLSQKQKEIVAFSREAGDVLVSVGTIRSGKTFSSVLAFILYTQSLDQPYKHLLLGRKLRVLEAEILPQVRQLASAMSLNYRYLAGTQTLFIGRQVYFLVAGNHERSLDRIQGITAHSALVDEATLIPESFSNTAMSRLTYNGSKAWLTCNPSYPGHYIKKKWIDEGKVHKELNFDFDDNPSLGEKVVDRYKSQFSGVFRRRMIGGEWCAAEGLIYPHYISEDLLWTDNPKEKDLWYKRKAIIGADYGTANPSAYIPLLQLEKRNRDTRRKDTVHYIPECVYIDGGADKVNKSDKELADQLVSTARKYGARAVVIDPNAASFELELIRHPRRNFAIRRGYRPVNPGIRITNNALEKGLVIIAPEAMKLLDEMDSYAWDPEKDEIPTKQNDHACDAMRYAVCDTVRHTASNRQIGIPAGM